MNVVCMRTFNGHETNAFGWTPDWITTPYQLVKDTVDRAGALNAHTILIHNPGGVVRYNNPVTGVKKSIMDARQLAHLNQMQKTALLTLKDMWAGDIIFYVGSNAVDKVLVGAARDAMMLGATGIAFDAASFWWSGGLLDGVARDIRNDCGNSFKIWMEAISKDPMDRFKYPQICIPRFLDKNRGLIPLKDHYQPHYITTTRLNPRESYDVQWLTTMMCRGWKPVFWSDWDAWADIL